MPREGGMDGIASVALLKGRHKLSVGGTIGPEGVIAVRRRSRSSLSAQRRRGCNMWNFECYT